MSSTTAQTETVEQLPTPDSITGFQIRILTCIRGLPVKPSGQDIKEAIEDYFGETITAPRVYQNLTEMEEMGVIEKGEVDGRTNYYSITRSGEGVYKREREFIVGNGV